MSIVFNGVEISPVATNPLTFNDAAIEEVVFNGVSVWTKYLGPPSPVVITIGGDLIAGVDFPAGVDVSVCAVGGGGSGGRWGDSLSSCGGGYAGDVVTEIKVYDLDEVVTATIGNGGNAQCGGTGRSPAGTETTFGVLTAAGGIGGAGGGTDGPFNGEEVTTCGGTGNNGSATNAFYGGQSSGFGDGGLGTFVYGGSTAGGIGCGGGSNGNESSGSCSGAGGDGQITLTW